MSSILVIYIAGSAVAAVCIALALINWFQLSSISAKIAGVEEEISKKSSEFDTLRKELQQQRNSPANPAPVSDSLQPIDGGGQIEVVRSVRTGFQSSVAEIPASSTAGPAATAFAGSEVSSPVQHSAPPPTERRSPVSYETPARVPHEYSSEQPIDEVEEPPHTIAAITIPLFSESKKDADFPTAWKMLTDMLPRHSNPMVRIDMKHILFLYPKEIKYLEQFQQVIAKCNGTLRLRNCQQELKYILQTVPSLVAEIEE
jgi:hypothetical protein